MHTKVTLIALPAGSLLFLASFWITSTHPVSASSSSTEVIPFTATIRSTAYAPSSASATVIQVYSRRRDRSFVHEVHTTAPDGTHGIGRDMIDLERLQTITLDPFTQSVTTTRYALSELSDKLNSMDSENCPAALPRGPSKTVFGYTAIRNLEVYNSVTSESWVIPELQCFPVRQHDQFPTGGHSESVVTSLSVGDPPAELFDVPSDYTERSPRQLEELFDRRFPGHHFYGEKLAAKLEVEYQRHAVGN